MDTNNTQNKILIVSATSTEIEPLRLALKPEKRIANRLSSYKYNNLFVDILLTGVGMVSTAFYLGKTFSNRSYTMALNFGIAGCFDKSMVLGSIVNITEDCLVEMGAEDGADFLSAVETGLMKEEEYIIKNTSKIDNPVLDRIPVVNGITVNTVHGNIENINKIKTKYNPVAESMEGGAFLNACLTDKIPCAQVRAVSNHVERDRKSVV